MYSEIQFQTDRFTEIAQILTESGLSGDLIKYIIETDRVSFPTARTDTVINSASGASDDTGTIESIFDTWDITDWINDLRGSTTNTQIQRTIGNDKMIFMGGESMNDATSNDPSNNLYRALMSTLLYSKLLQLSKNSFRTMDQIYNSALSPSETVFYEIKKYSGDQIVEDNAIQSFYFINSNDVDVLKICRYSSKIQ